MFYVPGAEAPLPLEVAISLKDITEVMSLYAFGGRSGYKRIGSQPKDCLYEAALEGCLGRMYHLRTEVRVSCNSVAGNEHSLYCCIAPQETI